MLFVWNLRVLKLENYKVNEEYFIKIYIYVKVFYLSKK